MGVYSDVAICLKTNVIKKMSFRSMTFLYTLADCTDEEEEGKIFHVENIKWYWDSDFEIKEFLAELNTFDDGDYYLIQACHDCPSAVDGDRGSWWKNPWGAEKCVDVSIKWYGCA
jgi:hypothetical protein